MSNEKEVKSLIEEQGRLVEAFRKEVVDKIETTEEKQKTYINEKDARMSKRLDEIDEKFKTLSRPESSLGQKDAGEEKEELNSLYTKFVRKGFNKFDREDADKLRDLAAQGYAKRLNKAAGDPVLSYTDASGGHLIPEFMYQQILNNFQEQDPMRAEADVIEITSNKIEFHTGFDASAGWEAESFAYNSGTAPDAADPSFSRQEVSCNVLAGQVRLSLEALEDIPNIGSYVTERLATKMAATEGGAFIDGDGSGKPLGFNTTTIEGEMNSSQKITMASSSVFDFDEFYDALYSLPTGYWNTAKWFFNQDTLAKLRKVQDSQGNYLWQGALIGADKIAPATIAGRPYAVMPTMENLSTNIRAVYVGDMKQAYKIIQRVGVSVVRLDEFQYPDVLFIARTRVGGRVVLPEALSLLKGAAS